MGEYIHHPETKKTIKIGVMARCFFSKENLLKLREMGFKGFYGGYYNENLDRMIEDHETIFENSLSIEEALEEAYEEEDRDI